MLPPTLIDRGTFDGTGKYWNSRRLDGYDRAWNLVLGPREPGKSAYFSHKAWKRCCKHGETLVYVVRNVKDCDWKRVNKLRQDISKFYDVPAFSIKGSNNAGTLDILVDGFPFARFVALNQKSSDLKQCVVPNPSFVWFDEFTCNTKAGERYLDEEASKFRELYTTLVREKRGLKCYFTGNVYSLYNPYALDWGIDVEALRPGIVWANEISAIEMVTLTDRLRDEVIRKNPAYRFDDVYSRYALDGKAMNDGDLMLVPARPRDYRFRFALRTGGKTLGVYSGDSNEMIDTGERYRYWVGWAEGRERKTAIAYDIKELVAGSRVATKVDHASTLFFKMAMGSRKVAFQDLNCYYLLEEIWTML